MSPSAPPSGHPKTKPESSPAESLRLRLERAYLKYDKSFLSTDPVEIAHEYVSERDQELAALFAAGLAFGNAQAVRRSTRNLFDALGPAPSQTVTESRPVQLRRRISTIRHRWIGPEQIAPALETLRGVYRKGETLEDIFVQGIGSDATDLSTAMDRFVEGLPALRPFFAAPSSGSACKRFCLFLRWMVRKPDGIDLGIWTRVSPAQLVVPLDVHVARVARAWGLTRRRADDWKTALEITRGLRSACPHDPLRYDFALCRIGMLRDEEA